MKAKQSLLNLLRKQVYNTQEKTGVNTIVFCRFLAFQKQNNCSNRCSDYFLNTQKILLK